MRVRGRRQCQACGSEWSYYETGEPACPDCGSLRSVGLDEERTLHTDAPATLDLAEARSVLDDRPRREVASAAERAAREYMNRRGFVDAGELLPLDDTYLAAAELRAVAGELRRLSAPGEDAHEHFLQLLRGAADGDRPTDVPERLRAARGLATAAAVGDFRRDVLAWLDDRSPADEPAPEVRSLLDRLRAHERRVEAVDGDVRRTTADRLETGAQAIGEHLRSGDVAPLDRAAGLLDELDAAAG